MPIEPRHPLVDIKDALSDFVAKESELAAAELKPAAKTAGIGGAFFAGAAIFLFHALWMFVILIALAIGLLLHAVTPLGPWASFTLGFLVSVLISALIAGILFTLGRGKIAQLKKPEATISEAKATLDAVVDVLAGRPSPVEVVLVEETITEFSDKDLETTFGRD